MTESKALLGLIQENLDEFCNARRVEFEMISPDLVPVVDYTQDLLRGGKRFRALFTYWSWVGALESADLQQSEKQRAASAEAMVSITAALEMFHAAALVHDDLLDQSDTRRGAPSVHKRFEALHQESGWAGSSERFGTAGSVLVGDLMLGWSSELFGNALLNAPTPEIETACRNEFSKMRVEVMAGQYLDVLEENAAPTRAIHELVGRANRVMLYKTAKYSIEAPLLIGAAFAGAGPGLLRGLSAFGIPLGMAFQLKDDILGVFGDPAITGKPAGDDLREGKRTALIAFASQTPEWALISGLVGSSTLSDDEAATVREVLERTGAKKYTQRLASDYADEAVAALHGAGVPQKLIDQLTPLVTAVVERVR